MEVSAVEVRRQRAAPGGDTPQRTSAWATGVKVLAEALQMAETRLGRDRGSGCSEGASTSSPGLDRGVSALAVPLCQQPRFQPGTSAVKAFLSKRVSSWHTNLPLPQ